MGINTSCLAIDIGASGGRVLAGFLTNGKMTFKPIHRFANSPCRFSGKTLWDIDTLRNEMVKGLSEPFPSSQRPGSLGIDTWGVDYVVVDSNGRMKGPCYSYRDSRTENVLLGFFQYISPEQLYEKTGIQILRFNTLFQMFVSQSTVSGMYSPGDRFLMLPDWLHYSLTGEMVNEFTNLTTTQLCVAGTGRPDSELLRISGIPFDIFPRLVQPGMEIGHIRETGNSELSSLIGVPVITPGTHDTASAVAAIPSMDADMPLFISSGTWSLMGVETAHPVISAAAFRANFTNEGGVFGRTRLLKNIMGLWLLQRVRGELPEKMTYPELGRLAQDSEPFRSLIDPGHDSFLDPPHMGESIRNFCREHDEPIPDTPARLVRCIYDSLALSYHATKTELEIITGRVFRKLHIIGGGSQDGTLCQLTADMTGLEVLAGPVEATAIGNALVQFIGQCAIPSLEEGRVMIRESFGTESYLPRKINGIEYIVRRFSGFKSEYTVRSPQ